MNTIICIFLLVIYFYHSMHCLSVILACIWCQGFEKRALRLRCTLPVKHIELRAAVLQHLISVSNILILT